MNQLIVSNNKATMSSREIAELTGKEHKNVKADILKMLAELKEDALKFQRIYTDSMNRVQTEYLLDRELTETLLTGYSAILRRKVIARWKELEAKPAANLIDPAFLRSLLLGYTEQVIALEQKIEAQLPAVEFMEQVSDTSNFVTIPEFAKTAGSGSVRMYQLLRDHGFLNEKNIPYQKHINSGWFKTIIKVSQHPKSGADIFYSLTLISGRGAFNVTRLMQRAA